jgi:hypothetical protein
MPPQDVHIRLSTAEDGVVDFKDNSLPSVTWEGIEYGDTKWEREWDTFWDVPLVSPPLRTIYSIGLMHFK